MLLHFGSLLPGACQQLDCFYMIWLRVLDWGWWKGSLIQRQCLCHPGLTVIITAVISPSKLCSKDGQSRKARSPGCHSACSPGIEGFSFVVPLNYMPLSPSLGTESCDLPHCLNLRLSSSRGGGRTEENLHNKVWTGRIAYTLQWLSGETDGRLNAGVT